MKLKNFLTNEWYLRYENIYSFKEKQVTYIWGFKPSLSSTCSYGVCMAKCKEHRFWGRGNELNLILWSAYYLCDLRKGISIESRLVFYSVYNNVYHTVLFWGLNKKCSNSPNSIMLSHCSHMPISSLLLFCSHPLFHHLHLSAPSTEISWTLPRQLKYHFWMNPFLIPQSSMTSVYLSWHILSCKVEPTSKCIYPIHCYI